MRTFLRLIQIIFGTSCNDIFLMRKIVFQHLRKSQDFWLKASVYSYQTKHDYTKSILKLCMLVQLIQNYICIGIFAEIDTDTHTFTAGMVVKVGNSVDFLFTYQLGNLFNQAGFINQIRKFCDNDT